MLNTIKTMIFYLAITFCLLLIIYGVCNSSLLRKIKETGELTIFDEVYTCTYKGKVN